MAWGAADSRGNGVASARDITRATFARNTRTARKTIELLLWGGIDLPVIGDAFAASMKSVMQTCRKQKRHVQAHLTEATQAHLGNRPAPSRLAVAP